METLVSIKYRADFEPARPRCTAHIQTYEAKRTVR